MTSLVFAIFFLKHLLEIILILLTLVCLKLTPFVWSQNSRITEKYFIMKYYVSFASNWCFLTFGCALWLLVIVTTELLFYILAQKLNIWIGLINPSSEIWIKTTLFNTVYLWNVFLSSSLWNFITPLNLVLFPNIYLQYE